MTESEIETLDLHWEGPIIPGEVDPNVDPDWLKIPAVYLCETTYDPFSVVYVGQTNDFLSRLRSHLVATISLTYWLRDETGAWVYEPGDGYHFLSQMEPHRLESLQSLARDTITRQRWFFAQVEPEALKPVEGLLIRAVKRVEEERYRDPENNSRIVSDNGNLGMALGTPFRISNSGANEAINVLGSEIVWPLEDAA